MANAETINLYGYINEQLPSVTVENSTKTFAVASASSGGLPAIYECREGYANRTVFPRLEISAKKNGTADARKVRVTLNVPVSSVDALGVTRKVSNVLFVVDAVFPDLASEGQRELAIAMFGNALASSAILSTFKSGYAPT